MSDMFDVADASLSIEQYRAHVRSGKEYSIPPICGRTRYCPGTKCDWTLRHAILLGIAPGRSAWRRRLHREPSVADVFVSYVSEDRAIAEKISRGLEGVRAFRSGGIATSTAEWVSGRKSIANSVKPKSSLCCGPPHHSIRIGCATRRSRRATRTN